MAYIDNLVAYYSCDEASGDLLDAHSTHDAVETGGTIAATTGKVSGGRDFERDDTEYGLVANHADVSMGSGAFSVSFWLKAESAGPGYIVSKMKTSSAFNGYGIFVESTYAIKVQVSDGTLATIFGSSTALSDAGWHHVVVTRSGATIVIYLDGSQDVSSGGGRSGDLDFAVDLFIGSFSSGAASFFDGVIDELGIWKGVALDSTAVTWLYNAGAGRSYADIVAEAGGGSILPLVAQGMNNIGDMGGMRG
jgi:hypothetical protein